MRLPRDIDGTEFVALLKPFGYAVSRQSGSHLRLTSYFTGVEHHITIPNHKPVRVGTLNSILAEVALYLGKDKDELITTLFG